MDHLAIMKKSWGLIPKILNGTKNIESRWLKNKSAPWDKVKASDTVYFKNSGELIVVKAKVSKVLQFDKLNPRRVEELLNKFHRPDGIEKNKIDYYYKLFKDKKCCILVFLKNPQKVKPFSINKSGFGSMSSWMAVSNIKNIRL